MESVIMVTKTDEATAGSAPSRSSASGTSTPGQARDDDVGQHRGGDDPPSMGLLNTKARDPRSRPPR
jgi:hypothetical protein